MKGIKISKASYKYIYLQELFELWAKILGILGKIRYHKTTRIPAKQEKQEKEVCRFTASTS